MAETLTAGDAIVDFTLRDSNGKTYDSAAARKRGLLLFALYKQGCGTCQYAAPFFQRFHVQYAGDKFQMWGISQDSAEETLAFAQEHGVTFPLLLDEDLDVTEQYDLRSVPGVYLVDETNAILRYVPAFVADEFNAMAQVIAERTGAPYTPVVRPEDDAPALRPG